LLAAVVGVLLRVNQFRVFFVAAGRTEAFSLKMIEPVPNTLIQTVTETKQ
jgi:hypothetical protein